MARHRYFAESPISSDRVTLAGSEAHHLLHVMRAQPGMELVLFDGSGAEFAARIEAIKRASVDVAVLARHEIDRELPGTVTLGIALPKGDRQRWLVEKAVELGVSGLVPLRTERGVAQPVDQAQHRLKRAVIEASKQCGRNRLMEIAAPAAWAEFVAAESPAATRLLAHPAAPAAAFRSLKLTREVLLAVGPEGGLTGEEVALANQSGWQAISLGPRILRVETAAAALTALVADAWRA